MYLDGNEHGCSGYGDDYELPDWINESYCDICGAPAPCDKCFCSDGCEKEHQTRLKTLIAMADEKYSQDGCDEIDWSHYDAEYYIRRYGGPCEYIGNFIQAFQYLEQ